MKNKKIIIIIAIIAILAILGRACLIISNNNKIQFAKYIKEMSDTIEKTLEDTNFQNYTNKKQNTPYENIGELLIKLKTGNTTNSTSFLSFEGKVNNTNKNVEQNIRINYSDMVSWPIIYVQNNDKVALKSEEIDEKYFAIENNNLKDFVSKLGIDSKYIPNKIENENGDENLKSIINKYTDSLTSNMQKAKFISQEEEGIKIYLATLTGEQVKEFEKELLSQLKEDDEIINFLNSNKEEYKKCIDEAITKIDETDYSNKYLKLAIYPLENEFKFTIETDQIIVETLAANNNILEIKLLDKIAGEEEVTEIDIVLEKNVTQDSAMYNMNIDLIGGTEINLSVTSEVTEIDSNKPKEQYTIDVRTEQEQFTATITNVIEYKDSVNVTELTQDNTKVLNKYKSNDLQSELQNILIDIIKVHIEKVEQTGAEKLFNIFS